MVWQNKCKMIIDLTTFEEKEKVRKGGIHVFKNQFKVREKKPG